MYVPIIGFIKVFPKNGVRKNVAPCANFATWDANNRFSRELSNEAREGGLQLSRGEHSFSSSSSYFLVINYHCFLWHRDFPSPYSFQSYQQNMGPCGSPSSAQFWPKCAECCLWLRLVWCRWWWWYFDAGLYMAAISNSIHDGQIQPPALINNVND